MNAKRNVLLWDSNQSRDIFKGWWQATKSRDLWIKSQKSTFTWSQCVWLLQEYTEHCLGFLPPLLSTGTANEPLKVQAGMEGKDTSPKLGIFACSVCLYLALQAPLEGIKRVFKPCYIPGSKLIPPGTAFFWKLLYIIFPKAEKLLYSKQSFELIQFLPW